MATHYLIVIDMLNDFLDRWDADERAGLIGHTNHLIAVFRELTFPVIWVRQAFKPDLSDAYLIMRDKKISVTIEGTRGSQIDDDLDCRPSDTIVIKKRYSAFFGTNLDDVLNQHGPALLVLAGVNTHACIRTTAIDAYQRDYRVVLARDCTGSYDHEHARISLDYMDGKIASVMANTEIEHVLSKSSVQP